MDENKLKAIVEEVVNKAIDPIKQQLNDPEAGLEAINRRLDSNTAAVMRVEAKMNAYGDMYKINDSNIRKVKKRLETVEEKEGIQVPPEFQLAPVADI